VNDTTIDSDCDVKDTEVGVSGIVYGITELVLVADKEFPRSFTALKNTLYEVARFNPLLIVNVFVLILPSETDI
jgi:hypothetical protein